MGFVVDLIILILAAFGFAVINACFIGGTLYLLHRFMGPSEESEAFDFSGEDQEKMRRFILLTVIHGAIPAAAVVLIGYILRHISDFFNAPVGAGAWSLWFILLILQMGGTFIAAKPLQKVEPKRALILMAPVALAFMIYYGYAIERLLK